MRLIFAGTPDTAVPSLERLIGSHHDVVAVLTRPDARVGRGRRVTRSPVAEVAAQAGIRVLQPTSLRGAEAVSELASYHPDACAVVAFGALIPVAALAVPRLGWINLHFSLLPAWRGAAPVQHAIWHGDEVTGATTFLIEEGLDTGPVFGTMVEPLGPRDTSGEVLARLSESGAGLLAATMDGLEAGKLTAVPQPSDGVTMAPKITVDDARIDWTRPALQIDRRVRACTPAPGAWSILQDARVKVFPVEVSDEPPQAPGVLVAVRRNSWLVGTGTSPVVLGDVQPAGKRRMAAADWFRGLAPAAGRVMS